MVENQLGKPDEHDVRPKPEQPVDAKALKESERVGDELSWNGEDDAAADAANEAYCAELAAKKASQS
jgi:hypothetical protein